MTVTFGSTSGGIYGIATHKIGEKTFIFKEGLCRVESKEDIMAILGSEIYRRNEIVLIDDVQAVDEYLSGKEPDRITFELLDKVSTNVIYKLAVIYGTRERRAVSIIKAELVGKFINTEASEVIGDLEAPSEEPTNLLEKAIDKGVLTFKSPWYRSADNSFSTRKKAEAEDWCIENILTIEE
jgi:hypothetical protein